MVGFEDSKGFLFLLGEKVMWGPAGKMGVGVGRAWLMEILLCQTEVWTWPCVEWRTSKDFMLEDSRIGFAWWKDNSGHEDLIVGWWGGMGSHLETQQWQLSEPGRGKSHRARKTDSRCGRGNAEDLGALRCGDLGEGTVEDFRMAA